MLSRIGCFFLTVGGLVLLIFLFSDIQGTPIYQMLATGIILTILGGAMMRKGYKPPPQSERFRIIRSYRQRQQQKKE